MEPQIWSQLPQELLEHILIFLPLKTLFNLRTTCKFFYSLIFSPSFISCASNHTPLPPFSTFLLLSHPHFPYKFPLYDSSLNHWHTFSLPFSSTSPSQLLCSTNGLLCFSKPSSFLITNLLSRSSSTINFPTHPFHFESVTLIPSSSTSYKLFILCSTSSTFIYNSDDNSWSRFASFDPIPKQNSHQEGVFSNGYVYFTTPEPFSIMEFDLETGTWSKSLQGLPEEVTFVRLVSHEEGKLYLVGGIGHHGISRRLKIWELRQGGSDWIEIGTLPELMCRKFMSICYHNYEHVYCFFHDGLICVCCYTWPELLYYRMGRHTWHWLPKCPDLPEKWSCGFRWFSFVPNLYSSV